MRPILVIICISIFGISCSKQEAMIGLLDTPSYYTTLEAAPATSSINVPIDYPTIQEAIDAASDNDKIFVAAGVYDESIITINGFQDLQIRAENGAIVNGRVRIESSANITLYGLTINSIVLDNDEHLIDVASDNGEGIRIIGNTLMYPTGSDHLKTGIRFFPGKWYDKRKPYCHQSII